jgi:betaine-aldehyde dehydrogenase
MPNLERAAAASPGAVFGNAGQDCCARSRILVERSAYDRFVSLLVDATAGVGVGDPENDSTEMGPLISAAQRESVSSFVNGDVVFKGEAPEGKGFWFPCTLVEASNDDRVAREEVTENGARALRVARALDTGVLSINANTSVRVSTPFGGVKQSGFGRELGMHALEGYSEVKNVFVATE